MTSEHEWGPARESVSYEQARADFSGALFRCRFCTLQEEWTTASARDAAVLWHSYDHHRPTWQAYAGDDIPRMARPVEYGSLIQTSMTFFPLL